MPSAIAAKRRNRRAVLEKSGTGTSDLGVEVEKRIPLDQKYLPQILTSWDRLQRLLRETIDEAHYHLGHTFEHVDQDCSREVVHFPYFIFCVAPQQHVFGYPIA